MPTTMKDSVDAQNKTVVHGDRTVNQSPNPHIIPGQKQDLNMTAPLHSDQAKNRKLVNEYVGSPIQNINKIRDNSVDYNTI